MSTLRQYILHRRDTGTNWSTVNTVLRAGELGIELDADSLRVNTEMAPRHGQTCPIQNSANVRSLMQ